MANEWKIVWNHVSWPVYYVCIDLNTETFHFFHSMMIRFGLLLSINFTRDMKCCARFIYFQWALINSLRLDANAMKNRNAKFINCIHTNQRQFPQTNGIFIVSLNGSQYVALTICQNYHTPIWCGLTLSGWNQTDSVTLIEFSGWLISNSKMLNCFSHISETWWCFGIKFVTNEQTNSRFNAFGSQIPIS